MRLSNVCLKLPLAQFTLLLFSFKGPVCEIRFLEGFSRLVKCLLF
ncbi:unnamed protein product [Rodentolepis nana]|uniref:Uncharacterized protein n=1 Tax=Rodentolepis nana TaxID=102285 RepID=A0A0R3TBE2_RODNA|nr:unnamed protein product [Rodentolepis nana]